MNDWNKSRGLPPGVPDPLEQVRNYTPNSGTPGISHNDCMDNLRRATPTIVTWAPVIYSAIVRHAKSRGDFDDE